MGEREKADGRLKAVKSRTNTNFGTSEEKHLT